MLCGSIEDLGEDVKFLLQAGDHEDCEVIMSRAAKLTAMERMMLPSRVVSRIVNADNKLRAKRRAAKRREEKKKLDAELNQAIAARLAQPRRHTATGWQEDQFYLSREAYDKALESYKSLCKERDEKPATIQLRKQIQQQQKQLRQLEEQLLQVKQQSIELQIQLLAWFGEDRLNMLVWNAYHPKNIETLGWQNTFPLTFQTANHLPLCD